MKTSKTLSPKQKKIAQVAGDPNKIEAEDFKKGREKGAEKSKKFKERVKEKFGETVGKITGKKIGGSAIKARDGVEIKKLKKLGKEVGEAAKDVGPATPSAAIMKYFKANALKQKDRLTQRDYGIIKDRLTSRDFSDREEGFEKGFSDAEISAMGKKAGGAAIKGKGAVARDRGMGLQDESISVGKGADYIKDLI